MSNKLSIRILLLAALIFLVSLGILFTQSRHMIRAEAINRTNSMLNATMQKLCRNLTIVEAATRTYSCLIPQNIQPDTLLGLTHRLVRLNSHIDGCSISMEPDVFPQYGRYFSTYSIRQADTVATVIEQKYEYFDRIWYKTPHDLGKPCWVVFYDDTDSLALTLEGLLASYGMPLYNADQRLVGIISTDLSLIRLSKIITSEEKPYPNAYFMMIDKGGHLMMHPDSTRLFTQTIYDGVDPKQQADLIVLGHEMTEGKQGHMSVVIDDVPSIVCYQPVTGTSWSLALVCPDSDVLANYHQLTYIVIPLLVIGLFLIFLMCRRAVSHAIHPLNQLLVKTQSIAEGNMEVHIPHSPREDSVGRLQNSFATMLQSLNFHMGSVRYITEQTRHRNEELALATRQAKEADRQKTTFIQNVTHQIRTPLNIMMGFAQLLASTQGSNTAISEEEMKGVTESMNHNATLLSRLVLMLFDSSDTGLSEELNSHKHEEVPCNAVANECIGYIHLHYPDLPVNLQTEVPDDFCVESNRLYLMRSLRELLYNAAKYSDGQHVTLRVSRTDTTVRFAVEDTGKGISNADREQIFNFFAKVDDLSEGLGLGLPLARRHARNLGGDLFLDTSYHDGCRFILELPLTSA